MQQAREVIVLPDQAAFAEPTAKLKLSRMLAYDGRIAIRLTGGSTRGICINCLPSRNGETKSRGIARIGLWGRAVIMPRNAFSRKRSDKRAVVKRALTDDSLSAAQARSLQKTVWLMGRDAAPEHLHA